MIAWHIHVDGRASNCTASSPLNRHAIPAVTLQEGGGQMRRHWVSQLQQLRQSHEQDGSCVQRCGAWDSKIG